MHAAPVLPLSSRELSVQMVKVSLFVYIHLPSVVPLLALGDNLAWKGPPGASTLGLNHGSGKPLL